MNTCVLTIIKNEHLYLDEWIKYHLDIGVDHLFIFEDIDSDSHKEITDKYESQVTLIKIESLFDKNELEQINRYRITKESNPHNVYLKKCLVYLSNSFSSLYDWCFVIDNDEFLTLENSQDSLTNIMQLYSDYDAVILQWKCYGANGLVKKPDYTQKGVIDTYTKELTGYVPANSAQSYTKTCYNLKTYKSEFFKYVHQPSDKCNFCRTNFERDRLKPVYDKVYLRHYITRSWEEFVWKKLVRGFLWGGPTRNLDIFFVMNPDMNNMKDELIKEVTQETLVVLPYSGKRAQGKEIELALAGWKKHCKFKYHFVVIGEFSEELRNKFPWVEFVYLESLPKKQDQYNPHLDILNKMRVAHEMFGNKYDGFIYMVDDNYAIKDFSLSDIKKVYCHRMDFVGNPKAPTSFWSHNKWKTRQLLDRENLPHINYTSHFPYYMEFKKLNEICNKYNMYEESYVFDDVYFNYFTHEEPILDDKIRLGIWSKDIFKNKFQEALEDPNIKFICNSVEGWSKELEESLKEIIEKE